jgi:hypothetical protein
MNDAVERSKEHHRSCGTEQHQSELIQLAFSEGMREIPAVIMSLPVAT